MFDARSATCGRLASPGFPDTGDRSSPGLTPGPRVENVVTIYLRGARFSDSAGGWSCSQFSTQRFTDYLSVPATLLNGTPNHWDEGDIDELELTLDALAPRLSERGER